MDETLYRKLLSETVNKIFKALDSIDPDIVECENSHGALTLTFKDQSRCIVSGQPSVRQLWLALASLGVAYHFNWDDTQKAWLDDKGQGIELLGYLKKFLKKQADIDIGF